ncbi:MAG: hypothetical protein EAX96_06415 [Candidatus Lokiarchaeota archaeon]|nr:hypothetical protein [Candidatus Lokiarchaeota archaeon]
MLYNRDNSIKQKNINVLIKIIRQIDYRKTILGNKIFRFEVKDLLTSTKLNFYFWKWNNKYKTPMENDILILKSCFFIPEEDMIALLPPQLNSEIIFQGTPAFQKFFKPISELRVTHPYNNNTIFKIDQIETPKEVIVKKDQTIHKVCKCTVTDDESFINLNLWDTIINKVRQNSQYILLNGKISKYNDNLELNLVKTSELIEIIN